MKNIADKIKAFISSPRNIVIISHTNPDGDAIGSSLAMMHYLAAKKHRVHCFVPSPFPEFLEWMPGIENIRISEDDYEFFKEKLAEADVIFCLDFNSIDRMENIRPAFDNARAKKILIDHHIDKESFCDIEYATVETSSTSELVFTLIEQMGDRAYINKDIAECLFAGIMTDTGSFSYACEHARTFNIVAHLVELGIDTERIHRLVYDTYPENRLRLLGYCLSEKLVVMPEFSTAYIAITKAELDKFNYKIGDTEGIVNYTLGIKGVIFGALISERAKKIKISLRSKGNFDVNRIARQHFNGGGHKNAAGGDLYCTFEEAVQLFRSILPMYTKELKQQDT